jgi:molybdate transport system substrate-binding protein
VIGRSRLVTLTLVALAMSGLVAAPGVAQSPSAPPIASVAPTCPPVVVAIASDVPASPAPAVEEPDLTVFAAASLTQAFGDLAAPWSADHPGSELVLSLDSSSALRAQIEQGAPADVFASADTKNPQALADACLAGGPVTPFAGNTLVIVVPAGNLGGVTSPADLARPGLRVVAAGPDVPITKYATQVIANLAALTGYPADFATAVAANVVSEEDNVKAVLAKIELGEGDAAIVYVTDAASSRLVATIPIPDEANVPVTYAAVIVRASSHLDLAARFVALLTGQTGQEILSSHGFLPAP